jgi:hypothetical protein
VTAIFSQLPMSPLVGIARNLGWPIPQDLQYDGIAQGAVGYSMPDNTPRMDGEVMVANSTLAAGGAPPLRVASADLRFSGSAITLTPSVVSNDKNETATLEGNYDTVSGKLNASLSSEGMSIPSLRQQISVAGAPLLGQATAGTWSGHLRYASPDTAGDQPWTGEIHLKDTDIPFEAFAQPLHILAADAAIDGAGVAMKRLSFSINGIQGQGDYRYDAPAPRPHKFHISITQAEGSDIEKTLMPTLQRGNLLNYALNFGRLPVPAWLRAMRADGTVQIGGLTLGGIVLTNLKTRVVWDGAEVRFAHLQTNAGDASFSGGATANLSRRWPQYQINGELAGLPWRSGAMNAEGSLSTSGIGADLLSNMTAKGSFRGRQIDLAPLDTYDTIDSCFEWAWDARNPKLKLTQLVMTSGDETFVGSAETQENGQLLVRVSDGTKQIQAAGAVLRGDPLKPVTQ